ncbi:hypothetical protein HBI56_057730 [Parastagonospora nodorum]|uniref:Heterokaryon incompatibility domain-containing protein n=2 Tax=Phaeosphaeria nodorum (strain SN15 / ATCC MYA-4574 / FGSC 10173) TaxID=321614 RepID=A0A7U2IC17_PHANO|nr:hypothetical protein SNOG_12288 [Parastagonospora nodorum SN15]KAH3913798.1 hypothetical protein HBH56_094410 [Parastagonospora nodorum]EAT80101.2 hypothetical protein SNOG_12288 [Parastagonospora nodorum SN15]KAH3930383.1 hypothetical protein HBH54_108730 [Parastagonospora nodorum]KAH3966964.1 hypothetical protein HBH51_142130 [Parastagonospora nodorum]KAH4003212.1 hypothetical protein HBI10_070710 [Parastagonospora nodorum]
MSEGPADGSPGYNFEKPSRKLPQNAPASAERRPAPGSAFQYDSLDHETDSIRLIQILPGPDGEVVRCTIRHTTISESSYTCLSYTWQPEFPNHDVEINACSLSVGENLYQFLHAYCAYAMRRSPVDYSWLKYKRTLSPSLWIDAICIRQSDGTEKNHQVRQMSQIYTDADHVLIWLGQLEDCEHLFRDLNNAYNSRFPVVAIDEKERLEYELLAFYNSPYWSRLWVVQEILVACGTPDRKIAIFSGQQLIDFDSLYIAISKTTGNIGRFAITCLTNSQFHKYGRHSLFRTRPRGDFVVPSPLRDLLVAFPQECRDKRDRVFALLSVSNDTSFIQVDYDLTKGELFQHVFAQYVHDIHLDECASFGAILIESLELGDPSADLEFSNLSAFSSLSDNHPQHTY